ncbi:YvrJ family protein [Aerococcaceae bacterium NML191292]|nr:YvrJ family protein [Aerococcaceae bacterium NML210727]MCW6660512.1 YvrJ family protein [Aerococcaceae bacterium NML191292]MCW6662131.1 YvrJ family protein [Aerococcaceae bacterium NML201209]MCW6663903.1 YvrJ family protein [Aerococcaceae bacterium NML190073]MCW6667585.1 YvrJ family protein [Aerococcaceae bacterium NML190938]MCW6683126.1 YvrJ family protein [Aerococcaceae bacterium NML160702]MDO4775584.1 YvrJ family protein [Aerococcaceae bacterium]
MNLIGNFGFPIALVFYFLLRFEKKIDELSNTLQSLTNHMQYTLSK